jgi:hypothetical protein
LSAIDDIDTTNPSTSSVTGRISAATSTPPVALAGSDQIRDGYLVYVPGRKYKVGERVLLPIEKTAENPKNPRVFYPEKEMQSLRDSLQREGQMQAAIAYVDVDADGKHMLKGGHRTRRCLMRLKVPYIKVEFVARSDDAAT